MEIKICGLTKAEEAGFLNKNNVDYAGMVLFFPKSKRNIDIAAAREIMAALDTRIKRVAVVVSPSIDEARAIDEAGFDIIQIHGNLLPEVYEALTIDIWKAFNIKDIEEYESFKGWDKIKGFVFDSAEPGSGKAYDRSILEKIERIQGRKFILAGGLKQANVADAIAEVRPDVVDVSSGVEFSDRPGKNPELIDGFVGEVRKVTTVII